MIARVVARAEERAGFDDEALERVELRRFDLQRGLRVGDDVERVRGLAAERERAKVRAGDDGRVDEGFEGRGDSFTSVRCCD